MQQLPSGSRLRKYLPRRAQKLNENGSDVHNIKKWTVKSNLEDPCLQCFFVLGENGAKVPWDAPNNDSTRLYATCPGSCFIIEHFLAQHCSTFVSKNFVHDVSRLKARYVHDSRIVSSSSSSSSTVCEKCKKNDHHTSTKKCFPRPQLCFWFSMPSVQIENKTVTLDDLLKRDIDNST